MIKMATMALMFKIETCSKNQNGYYGFTIRDRNLQPKPNTNKCGSIFNLNIVLAMLDVSINKNYKWLPRSPTLYWLIKSGH